MTAKCAMVLWFFQPAEYGIGHMFGSDAEVFVEILVGRAGAEAAHADKQPVAANDRVPALANAGLDGDVDAGFSNDLAVDIFIGGKEQLEAGHRDDAGGNSASGEDRSRVDRN